jgi:hypothetical protein
MATVNFDTNEITAKIIYYGAETTGCNTLVRGVFDELDRQETSELFHFTEQASTTQSWYFNHRPEHTKTLPNCRVRCQVYSLPLEVKSRVHKQQVLAGADLIVALVDARSEYESTNLETLVNLERSLKDINLDITKIPVLLKITQGDQALNRNAREIAFSINPYGFMVMSHATGLNSSEQNLHQEVLIELLEHIKTNLTAPHDSVLNLTPINAPPKEALSTLKEHIHAFDIANESPVSSLSHADEDPNDFGTLDPRARIELDFCLEGHPDHEPSQVLSADIDRGHLHLDLILNSPGGDSDQRVHLVLKNRPTWTTDHDYGGNYSSEHDGPITESIPMTIEISRGKSNNLNDAKLSFGIIGLVAGVLMGLGLGFLFWF